MSSLSSTSSPYISSLRQSSAFPPFQMPSTAARAASRNMYLPTTSASQALAPATPLYDLKPDCFSQETNDLCAVPSHMSTPDAAYGYNAYAWSLR